MNVYCHRISPKVRDAEVDSLLAAADISRIDADIGM